MGDTGGASSSGTRDTTGAELPREVPSVNSRGVGGPQLPMEDLLGALAIFMEQHRANQGGQVATKALKAVVVKTGRFDGKNITKFLRAYVCEMEVHQVDENRMMETFDMAVVPDIRDRVQEIRNEVITWIAFAERLRDEYFDEDTERMTKRSFLEWVEQRPGNNMGAHELLKDFEKKFAQLPMTERRLLNTRKAELFLQAADAALEDRLLLLLGDRTTEGGFTNDWRRVEETVILLAKQQRVRSRGLGARLDINPIQPPKSPKVSFAPTSSTTSGSTLKITNNSDANALEELIKSFKELKVEMIELRKSQTSGLSSSSQPFDGGKTLPWRCIWCDKSEQDGKHRLRDCTECNEALKDGIVEFIDGKLHDTSTKTPLKTNFGRGGMKKLVEGKMGQSSSIHLREANSYHIEVEQHSIGASPAQTNTLMRRGAQAIRDITGWKDPVDASSIRAFLEKDQANVDLYEASVEEKRGRVEADDSEEPSSKKRLQTQNDPAKEVKHRVQTRSKTQSPSFVHPEDTLLPDKEWGQYSGNRKDQEKEDVGKPKGKSPAYKLQSDIETSINMKGVLEERILDAKIEFTLREALGIAKKDFHELIIDIIKRKRQMTAETVMVSALDTHMTTDEEIEIGEVFAMMGDHVTECNTITVSEMARKRPERVHRSSIKVEPSKLQEDKKMKAEGTKIEMVYDETQKVEVKTFEINCDHSIDEISDAQSEFHQPYWARATTETKVKLGGLSEPVLALVDHGSEINIISRKVYEKGKWPIDTDHGWVMRAANSGRSQLYGACPSVPAKIGDVEVEQNFFVQNSGAYPVLLGQPFITASRMETKVLDDGSHYARIRSIDGRKSVQFLTVRSDNERHRMQLREIPLPTSLNFPDF